MSEETASDVFSTIKECGPHAFSGLILCLAQLGHYDVIQALVDGPSKNPATSKQGLWHRMTLSWKNRLARRRGFEQFSNEINV